MNDLVHKICTEPGCNKKQPLFNFKDEKRGLYCKKHKKEEMVDVVHKKCLDCDKIPLFNFKDKNSGIYCKKHAKENMVCILSIKCLEPDCFIQPSFNFKDKKSGIYCKEHKKENMVDVDNIKCLDCDKRPHFNFENKKKGLYCFDHKKDKMIDVSHKRCLTNMCQLRGTKKYEGYCLFCFINTFPDKPVTRNYKTKEKAVSDYIKEQFPDVTWVLDKKIADGCSKRRPDLLLDLGYEVIIIEIDENQHSSYEDICENKRIMIISQDLNFRPIIFIRFNPDDYIINDKKITSCWGPDGNGIMSVKKTKKKEWIIRLEKLKETVTYWITNISEKPIEIDNLFFDEII